MSDPERSPAAVLIVEDDPLLMMSLVDFVEEAGCAAVEAATTDEAVGILETRLDIRMAFTDLDMRGPTAGMKLVGAIRDRWPGLGMLLISSQPWQPEQIPPGAVLVGKPFDERRIVAAIRKLTS